VENLKKEKGKIFEKTVDNWKEIGYTKSCPVRGTKTAA